MCELYVIVKLYGAACSLSDWDSYFIKKLSALRNEEKLLRLANDGQVSPCF